MTWSDDLWRFACVAMFSFTLCILYPFLQNTKYHFQFLSTKGPYGGLRANTGFRSIYEASQGGAHRGFTQWGMRGVRAILMSFVGTIEGPCCVRNCVEKAAFWQLVKNESGGEVLSSILSQIFQIYVYTMRVGVRSCMWDLIFYPVQGAYGSFYPYTQIKNMKNQ